MTKVFTKHFYLCAVKILLELSPDFWQEDWNEEMEEGTEEVTMVQRERGRWFQRQDLGAGWQLRDQRQRKRRKGRRWCLRPKRGWVFLKLFVCFS